MKRLKFSRQRSFFSNVILSEIFYQPYEFIIIIIILLSFFLSVLLLWSPILTQQETPLEWGWWNEQKYDNLMISQGKKIAIVAKNNGN